MISDFGKNLAGINNDNNNINNNEEININPTQEETVSNAT